MRQFDFISGEILLINKPLHWTSFDVVNKIRFAIRKFTGEKVKVGHAGTLDPLATGLLILCTGKKTKILSELSNHDKTYSGVMILGAETPSYDAETDIIATFSLEDINQQVIEEQIPQFVGEIQQIPPPYSAIKQQGKTLYKLARTGKTVVPKPRTVRIHSFEIEKINLPEIEFKVSCSKGTYIRSLVHDFGKSLNNGAYLSALVRHSIGQFQLSEAYELNDFINLLQANES